MRASTMDAVGGGLLVAAILAVGTSIAGVLYMSYVMERDIGGYIHRAQVAASAKDMAEYLSHATAGMEHYGMTRGHAAIFFKTPTNDMSLIYEALQNCRQRAQKLAKMPTDSTTYQVGLDDLRGTLREIEVPAVWWWQIHTTVGLALIALFILGVIAGLVGYLLAGAASYRGL